MDGKELHRLTGIKRELARRLVVQAGNAPDPLESIATSLYWLEILEVVHTDEAFERAERGEHIFMVYEDGTDTQLDDIEEERKDYLRKDYVPNALNTSAYREYPECETIFVREVSTGQEKR